MSWMADDGGVQVATPKRVHPNARSGGGCPWAQDTDVEQFKRGPPSRRESYGNPINHTGYQAAPASARGARKAVQQRGDGSAPWALEQGTNAFAAPSNAIGTGLGSGRTKAFNGTFQQGAPVQAMYQQQPPTEQYGDDASQPGSAYGQYAQPLPDDDYPGDEGYGYPGMPPQVAPPPQQRRDQAGGCPWAVSSETVMQTESRSQFAGMSGAPAFQAQRVLKPRATPPRGGNAPGNENWNMLHDSSNTAVETKSDNLAKQEAMLQRGQAAAVDARFAAQAIRNKMRANENCISWQ
uniref:Uncharacterized protein n=1 Tax=Hemiselmis tepida TaxID=464990 RepID=A0A6T6V2L2_9CRYP|mmetsp:Transcript_29129/g.73823  ORF Transcript_29129/g.73823 Transcript_29129/m.73823 type:complete len:294 (+) Transcript_29129:64-945(+)|eukprot:CAMPEP_0174927022 /NCGR_PEP_ID=MMETSP1355-20121228/17276_1 /TAXON_ID=464990 /ORGANISM="Hemiselmis tepida, Strain CCMP443" /LENGTH=293 /DNA_ID=CAMNT_0016173099 /DNA_START=45 /DNA_END=926 /DNA_ORIENTATION=+